MSTDSEEMSTDSDMSTIEDETASGVVQRKHPQPETAAKKLQALFRGHAARRDTMAILRCSTVAESVQQEASVEEAKWEPWVLTQEWRECKMLHGIPVDLITYEEHLLRLQMKLDNIQAGGVSEDARQIVRSLRREAVCQIQQRLDRIDACKQWWKSQQGPPETTTSMETEPIAVA